MVVKIDLEKAYDRVRLDFMNDSVVDDNILHTLNRIIMHFISSSSMQLLWNGGSMKHFILPGELDGMIWCCSVRLYRNTLWL
ncbi:putative Transposon TX1 [Gossypium australe]|uniref:Putative Transposon TX1 n=1 Tax=Gossypium australe TaxID=47621 RepID=A0A5B6W2M7_9ROSI|nr:putative Transposon TX1 [Gossypium australe]